MKKIVLSTGNTGKIEELRSILGEFDFDIVSKDQVGLGDLEVEEDKDTLEENALLKARAIWEKTGGLVLADDTGLFVDALDGEPGVYSARYAGENASDSENRKKLLEKLGGSKNRSARFKTVIAIVFEDGSEKTIEGICDGQIADEESGKAGFGYDSIFIPSGYSETFAELDSSVKNKISHRARALESLSEILSAK